MYAIFTYKIYTRILPYAKRWRCENIIFIRIIDLDMNESYYDVYCGNI